MRSYTAFPVILRISVSPSTKMRSIFNLHQTCIKQTFIPRYGTFVQETSFFIFSLLKLTHLCFVLSTAFFPELQTQAFLFLFLKLFLNFISILWIRLIQAFLITRTVTIEVTR